MVATNNLVSRINNSAFSIEVIAIIIGQVSITATVDNSHYIITCILVIIRFRRFEAFIGTLRSRLYNHRIVTLAQ